MTKTAIITGAGGNLGQAAALSLAGQGINIAVVDVNEEDNNETIKLVKDFGADVLFIKMDVSKAEYINGEVIRIDGGFTNTK